MILQETSNPKEIDVFNADFPSEQANMCFFYIGSDQAMFEHFSNHFEWGHKTHNLFEADYRIHQLYLENKRLPDVLLIDVPFDEKQLSLFFSNLKDNILFTVIPVIYNQKQLTEHQIDRIRDLHLADDIVAIDSHHFNYYGKIMLLKQSKLYNDLLTTHCKQKSQKKKPGKSFNFLIKRVVDILVAFPLILILSPFILIIAIAIKFESKGPVFYSSLRAGNGFKVFKFYKFRSMVADADKDVEKLSQSNQYDASTEGPKFFKINNDPRVTRFGRLLRNTSADELPQLFNVLIGDMSVVGNRPLPLYEAVSLTTDEFVERFKAPAGITGLWQVNKRGKAEMSVEERINLDITYSRKYNIFYDFKIIAKTPKALFQKSNV